MTDTLGRSLARLNRNRVQKAHNNGPASPHEQHRRDSPTIAESGNARDAGRRNIAQIHPRFWRRSKFWHHKLAIKNKEVLKEIPMRKGLPVDPPP